MLLKLLKLGNSEYIRSNLTYNNILDSLRKHDSIINTFPRISNEITLF